MELGGSDLIRTQNIRYSRAQPQLSIKYRNPASLHLIKDQEVKKLSLLGKLFSISNGFIVCN
jgi:hypothetical protein